MNFKHLYNKVENKIGLFGIILFGLEVLILLALVWKIPLNNIRLERIERNLHILAPYHPSDSKLISKKKFVGAPYSDTSSCEYAVGEFRSSVFPRESIRNAYAGVIIPSFQRRVRIPVQVRFADEGFLDDPWYAWRDEVVEGIAKKEQVYSLYVPHTQYISPFGDFRCFTIW